VKNYANLFTVRRLVLNTGTVASERKGDQETERGAEERVAGE
jgi:hypothetical protein